MRIEELAQKAADVINSAVPSKTLSLVLPGRWGQDSVRRLAPRGPCPIGQIVGETDQGVVVLFDAVEVLAWCMVVMAMPEKT